ncbi:TPA: hypothetical protein HA265_01790 [Candidatus Woesearchaeota archaeon]|nr:hypothetical protein [Candidatus Woesearchaeota archaeon]
MEKRCIAIKKEGHLSRVELGIEEAILVFLIAIELLDFFRVIHPVLEFIEKTLAIMAVCYLTYKVSITRVFFGHRKFWPDIMVIAGYLLLSVKVIIGFFIGVAAEKSVLSPFYSLVITNMDIIEKVCFNLGVLLIFVTSIVLVREKIGKPSFLYIIHENSAADSSAKKVFRALFIYVSFLAFFILVFNFVVEWLATTVDAPIMIIVMLMLLFVIVKHKSRMDAESLLLRITEASEEFYERVILMFQKKSRIAIGIIGVLVLHMVVEVGHFIIPYTTGLALPWYFPQLGPGHEPILLPMLRDFTLASGILQQFFVILVYMMNIIAILMLFIAPAYIWYYLYKDKKIVPGHLTWLFFGMLSVFFIAPVFRMRSFGSQLLIGTDILTQQIPFIQNVFYAILVGVVVSLIFILLHRKFPKRTAKVGFFFALVYFAFYLWYFVVDLWGYYINAIIVMFQNYQFVIGTHFFIFFALTILFYIGGYVMLIYEVYAKQKM